MRKGRRRMRRTSVGKDEETKDPRCNKTRTGSGTPLIKIDAPGIVWKRKLQSLPSPDPRLSGLDLNPGAGRIHYKSGVQSAYPTEHPWSGASRVLVKQFFMH
ncbi:hypothetical protein ElyMa_004596000 [Elysia marginata]|uniref:Uncharacterized protein n=1 Tax=Elysia marginata TaxID=1093978 RepID=A0AAV4HZ71_9GAST|nr:hypothetical protein ElyMa_004596000 [Elysia marginata]